MTKLIWAMRPMNERDLKVLELRESGHTYEEIAKKLVNQQTGQLGVSIAAARAIYYGALARKPRYELKKAKYARSIYELLMDETKYVYKK